MIEYEGRDREEEENFQRNLICCDKVKEKKMDFDQRIKNLFFSSRTKNDKQTQSSILFFFQTVFISIFYFFRISILNIKAKKFWIIIIFVYLFIYLCFIVMIKI